MQSKSANLHDSPRPLPDKVFIGVILFLTFAWTGSMAWLALAITLLVAGYAYLSRRQIGWQWVALPLGLAGYWILVILVAVL